MININPFVTLKALVPLCSILILPLSGAQTTLIPKGDLTIELELVCDGLTSPVAATHANDKSGRLFIVDQAGTIRVYEDKTGSCLNPPFLDVTDRMIEPNTGFDERGLLGLAFHPDYANNGLFYVRYEAPRDGNSNEPCFGTSRGCHTARVSEFSVSNPQDNTADVDSERILLAVDHPQFNHNGGDLAFGPDQMLYISMGDGGGANDGLADSPPSHGPIGHGQNIETLLGSILRIDVNNQDAGLEYAIPSDNPFAGETPGADEIYAYGLRNPYRFSFDTSPRAARKNTLYVGDVGQGLFEEINDVKKGGNYGWALAEGFHCFDPNMNTSVPAAACSGTGLQNAPLLNPIAEYNHGDGLSVIGGYVYRGSINSPLYGKYVFGEFSRAFSPGDGRLLWLDADGVRSDIFEFRIGEFDTPLNLYLFGMGRDQRGELYALTSTNLAPTGNGGQVWRISAPSPEVDGKDGAARGSDSNHKTLQ